MQLIKDYFHQKVTLNFIFTTNPFKIVKKNHLDFASWCSEDFAVLMVDWSRYCSEQASWRGLNNHNWDILHGIMFCCRIIQYHIKHQEKKIPYHTRHSQPTDDTEHCRNLPQIVNQHELRIKTRYWTALKIRVLHVQYYMSGNNEKIQCRYLTFHTSRC